MNEYKVRGIDCFKCTHFHYIYYYDIPFPVVSHAVCDLNHEKTSYNTYFGEIFECNDYTEKWYDKIKGKIVALLNRR